MRPLFTSRSEWNEVVYFGERAYVRDATSYLVRAGLLGFVAMVVGAGAADPYWRSGPILALFAICLAAGAGAGALLFRREWRAAVGAYGPAPIEAVETRNGQRERR